MMCHCILQVLSGTGESYWSQSRALNAKRGIGTVNLDRVPRYQGPARKST